MSEWETALSWDDYLASIPEKDRERWKAVYEAAEVDEGAAARLGALPGPRRVLVLSESWCGDVQRSVPVLAKAFAGAPQVETRYLPGAQKTETMLRYLSHGGKSVPMVVVSTAEGEELGVWGPRPAPLQAIFRAGRRDLMRDWYDQDGGRTAIQEILILLERGGEPR